MIDINTISLDSLPPSEADDLEYKSSLIDVTSLKREVQNAASAFWNSGGGVFVAGVRNDGVVDRGIDCGPGRQSLDDWLAQVISEVRPRGKYYARTFDQSDHSGIQGSKCVLAIHFAASTAIPHQSKDSRYYIRVGAHTLPAPHFIVDALYAQRHYCRPRLVHIAHVSPYLRETDALYVEVLAVTDGVALDVEIDVAPRHSQWELQFPISTPIIDREHPFRFRFGLEPAPVAAFTMTINYRDFADECYSYSAQIDPSKCLPPGSRDAGELGQISEEIRDLKRVLEQRDNSLRFR